ncbi:hypothetical protein C0Q70_10147 [Pomacea canaliculata]|uniref:Core Histone H2A/H2B/H3 domain-containing protein n=1 Tax=Pomacea canaliculata TaxID=400727 RepID=A0A2T7PBT8_POMCA|nr:hypothetical protein C0Q70_10147 [Pomacea canaliculata]
MPPPQTATAPAKGRKKGRKTKGLRSDSGKKKPPEVEKQTQTSSAFLFSQVLKQVHPDIGISSKAMNIMNSCVNDMFERIAADASRLAQYSKHTTLTSRDLQTAV